MRHIGLLLFAGVQQLDLTGPFEVFAPLPDTKRPGLLLSKQRGRIACKMGAVQWQHF